MQKKIIALAIAAAFSAPAFAESTVYGVVDAAVANVSADGVKGSTLAVSGGLAGSRIGVTSVEDIAYGMKAVVKIEYALDTQSGAIYTSGLTGTPSTSGIGAARQQMLAVAGDFGTVATGYLQTAGYDWAVKFDPTAGSQVSPLQNVTKAGGFALGTVAALARAPRALAYISPNFSGVTVAANYSTSADNTNFAGSLGNAATATDTETTGYLLSATYEAGPLAVGGVYASAQAGGTSAFTEFAFGGSYDLGMAKLFGTYQSNTAGAAGSKAQTAFSMGAVAPVGPGAVAVSYAASSMSAASSNGSGLTVGYLQGLSKTVTAYVAYSSMSQDSGVNKYTIANNAYSTALAGGASSSLIAAGIKKAF